MIQESKIISIPNPIVTYWISKLNLLTGMVINQSLRCKSLSITEVLFVVFIRIYNLFISFLETILISIPFVHFSLYLTFPLNTVKK